MQFWNEWTEKNRPQQQVVFVEEPKQESITLDSFNGSSPIESNLNGEEESSVVTQENYLLEEVDIPTIDDELRSEILTDEEYCSATIPILASDGIESSPVLMVPSEDVTGLDIKDLGEDDGASVKSDSSTSSAGSVWVMEDMVKSTASDKEPLYSKDEPHHHPGNILNFLNRFIFYAK